MTEEYEGSLEQVEEAVLGVHNVLKFKALDSIRLLTSSQTAKDNAKKQNTVAAWEEAINAAKKTAEALFEVAKISNDAITVLEAKLDACRARGLPTLETEKDKVSQQSEAAKWEARAAKACIKVKEVREEASIAMRERKSTSDSDTSPPKSSIWSRLFGG